MVRLIERSQPTKSFQTHKWNLYENIFRHFCPCQFKVQITTGINHNKWSLLKQLRTVVCCRRDPKIRKSFSQPTSKNLWHPSDVSKQHNEVELSVRCCWIGFFLTLIENLAFFSYLSPHLHTSVSVKKIRVENVPG